MHRLIIFLTMFLCLTMAIQAQYIYEPEGLNLPGTWNGWTNPPAANSVFGSSTQVSGGKVTKISTGTTRWQTTIKVAQSGGDIVGGNYEFIFTSGPSGSASSNTWKNGSTVVMNDMGLFVYSNGNGNNIINVSDGKWYVMNWKDNGYNSTYAIFMELSGEPVSIAGVVTNYSVANTAVTVTATTSSTPAPEEKVFVRYTTDGWVSSTLVPATGSGLVWNAVIPAEGVTGTVDNQYYVLTTTVNTPTHADADMQTIKNVPAKQLTSEPWQIKISAAVSSISDTTAIAGMSPTATDGYDVGIDLPKPPTPPSNYVEVFFPHTGWSQFLGNRYTRDFRSLKTLLTTTEIWDFTVNTDKTNQTVTLSFSELANIPSSYDIIIRDIQGETDHNVRTGGDYTYNSGVAGEKLFKLIIGVTLSAPQISVSPTSLSFGDVKLTQNKQLEVTISNTGQEDLVISSLESSNPAFTLSQLGNTTITSGNSEVLIVTFTPTTLEPYEGVITINSNSSENPTLEIPLSGTGIVLPINISANPTSLAFGTVKLTQDKTLIVTISNTNGEGSLNVTSVTSGNSVFAILGATSFTVPMNGSVDVSVKFTPTSAQVYSSELTFVSNATNVQGNLTVALSGTGTELIPNGAVSPTDIAFGNVAVGEAVLETITVSNSQGDIALVISGITFSGSGFSLNDAVEYPVTVAVNQTVDFSVKFKPIAVTTYEGVLTIASNNESALTVSLSGAGTKTTVQTAIDPGWNLLSVPVIPDVATPAAVFGDDFASYLLYGYSSTGGYTVPSTLNAGHGYWLGVETTGTLDVFGTANVNEVETVLVPGWNLIASPFNKDYLTAEVMFRKDQVIKTGEDAALAGWIQNVYYRYNGEGYSTDTQLLLWKGYWFSALMADVFAQFDEMNAGIPGVAPKTKEPIEIESDINNWAVQIIAASNAVSDKLLAFGANSNATDGFDALYDYAKPPVSPAANALHTYFEQAGWTPYFSKFGSDIRSKYEFPEAGKSWSFTVVAKMAGDISLTWPDINTLIPEVIRNNYRFTLTGPGILSGVNMLTEPSTSFTAEAGTAYSFTINSILTSLDDESVLPKEFGIGQNYPNPFNPATSIEYKVKESAQVTVVVYDMIGNVVATLVNEVKPGGIYTISFDASKLSSGVYFYKMQAGSFVQTKKLVLMK